MDPSASRSTPNFRFLPLAILLFTLLWSPISTAAQALQVMQGQDEQYHVESWELPSAKIRLCTPFVDECNKILPMAASGLECVHGNGKIGCLDLIAKRQADFMPLHSEELYVASLYGESAFRIVGEIRDRELSEGTYRYSPVAVVRNSAKIRSLSDLRGKSSCHTGYGRNAGWRVPFALLKPELTCPPEGPVYEKDIAAVSTYFKDACLGGIWAPEPGVDAELKKKYPNLCALCGGVCSPNSSYFGYEGAIKCLVNGADVAWTKLDAVVDYFKLNSTPLPITAQFSFLCLNGSTVPLTSPNACSTSARPWATILAHSSVNMTHVQSTLDLYSSIVDEIGVTMALEINTTTQVYYKYEKPRRVKSYLGNYAQSFEKSSCDESMVKYCVANELELTKCNELRLAMIGQRIKPGIRCIVSTDCLKEVEDETMDVVSGVRYLKAMERSGLTPLLAELRPNNPRMPPTPFSYSVALTRNHVRTVQNITELSGLKACHGSVNSVAGFRIPINYLRMQGLLKGGCKGFFNESCAPGSTDLDMCATCVGDNTDPSARTEGTKCADNETEIYHGDEGAIKCLLDGAGEVAFVNHVVILKLLQDSTQNETLSDLKLICPRGGQMKLQDFANCNWGRAPSRLVLTKGVDLSTRYALLKTSSTFGGRARPVMNLFGSWYNNDGLMFQANSVGLVDHDANQIDPNVNLDPCRSASNILAYSSLLTVFSLFKLFIAQ